MFHRPSAPRQCHSSHSSSKKKHASPKSLPRLLISLSLADEKNYCRLRAREHEKTEQGRNPWSPRKERSRGREMGPPSSTLLIMNFLWLCQLLFLSYAIRASAQLVQPSLITDPNEESQSSHDSSRQLHPNVVYGNKDDRVKVGALMKSLPYMTVAKLAVSHRYGTSSW